MHLDLNATELLLLMIALNLVMFAIGWLVATFALTHNIVTLRCFLAFNAILALALVLMALRGPVATPVMRIVPNLLLVAAVAVLTRGIYAFWSAYLPSVRFYLPVALAVAAIVWFGAIVEHDATRVAAVVLATVWLIGGLIWHTYDPTREEFGLPAAVAISATGVLVFVVTCWRSTLALLTSLPSNLNEPSAGSEFGLYLVLLVVTAPNLMYANFVAIRILRRSELAAKSDGLTGLLNHRSFMERADAHWSMRHSEQIVGAAIAIDLDYFKRINDEHGHTAGDEVLRSFAEILSRTFDESHIVGRTGGEEFIIIRSPASRESVSLLVDSLMRRVSRARWTARDTGEIRLTVSVGVALDLPTDFRPNDLLWRADQALYAAKTQGRNRVVYA
ncbi:MAG: GGDEF domain-containing protein [Burkholderiales bacterium]|nr:MAG: GGDEF domain-containing protein [Betaproteobacteria bacterium]TAG28356.1 MAG: GGDEF domain-containing protein [Burkholderiales bacterium]